MVHKMSERCFLTSDSVPRFILYILLVNVLGRSPGPASNELLINEYYLEKFDKDLSHVSVSMNVKIIAQ